MGYSDIDLSRDGAVATITFDRPEALNALRTNLIDEMADALRELDRDPDIGAVILTGSAKAFAAGADIKEMSDQGYMDMYMDNPHAGLAAVQSFRKPLIAAVNGYALGGGCEVAMMCDIIVAGEGAKFGQPEITLAVIPGFGGTQTLTRAVGKYKAMDMVLTGRMMDAEEAERAGLVSRVVPADEVLDTAKTIASKISAFSRPIVMMAKEAVEANLEMPLSQGIAFERRLFQSMFATQDQKEGMAAFSEKRQPHFKNK